MLEDRDLRQIRDIVAKEVFDTLREQLPKLTRDLVSDQDLRRELDKLEDRIVKRLQ